jgi:hypothetical protein
MPHSMRFRVVADPSRNGQWQGRQSIFGLTPFLFQLK